MRRHGIDVALFFNPANVRYATGTTVMTIYCTGSFVRCAVAAAEGEPILFEHPNSVHLTSRIVRDVRPMHSWESTGPHALREAAVWASEVLEAVRALGAEESRLAVDRLAPPAFLALQERGVELVDAGPITMDAREIKTPEEIELFKLSGAMCLEALADLEDALGPGVRERELLAIFTESLLRRGGEHLITRAVVSGPNTNPCNVEAGERIVEPGDLVFVDTDANCYEGYFIDISRTFLAGDLAPTPSQREAYRCAYELVMAMVQLARPGVRFEDFARRAPAVPKKYASQRYECLAHSAGLEDEGPFIPFPDDATQPMPDKEIAEGMVLCMESYVGERGASFGVKLEEQVLVTADGPLSLCPYPYADALLA